MTQAEVQNPVDVTPRSTDNSGSAARQIMSNLASDLMMGAATAGVAAAIGDGAIKNQSPATGTAAGAALDSILNNRINDRQAQPGCAFGSEKARLVPDTTFKVSDDDRKQAKETLAKELSELIPEEDRKLMQMLQAGIVDGNMEVLTDALKKLSADPAKLDKFIKALNKQLDGHEKYNGIDLARDAAGNVLIYKQNDGCTALSINPKTGETTVRAIEIQRDGSVLLKPGEIINRKAADELKALGDEATRAVVGPRYNAINWCPPPNHFEPGLRDLLQQGESIPNGK